MHTSEMIVELLIEDGFILKDGFYQCLVKGFAPTGQLSDGSRVVRIGISENGRWLSRVDGWHKIEKEIDLRDYYTKGLDGAKAAIYDVMKG